MNYNNNQNNILLNKLLIFYDNDNIMNKFVNIIHGKYGVSLRLIDWFVTNYSKSKNIIYNINEKQFNVFQNYKLMGKSFKKKKFDPFCRGDRIILNYKTLSIETTVGQLNFFKWAISNNIVDYITENKIFLDNEHSKYVHENKMKKENKNMEVNAVFNVYDKNVELIASFD